MKKVLLSGLALFAGLAASFGQSCSEGFFPQHKYAGDNFSKRQQWENVYWWTQSKPVTNVMVDSISNVDLVTCFNDSLPFTYKWTRDFANKKITYVMTQRYGKYEPVGVGWGIVDGKQNTLDLSGGNEKISFKFTNTSSYDIELRVGLQDSLKNEVNAFGNAKDSEVFKDEVKIFLSAGQSVDTTISYTPAGLKVPYKSVYKYGDCQVGSANGKNLLFNPKIVTAVMFTVVNQDNPEDADGYKPFTMHNVTFEISKFHVGGPVQICTGLEDNAVNSKSFKVMPNPASSYVEFPEAQNVKVMDAMGKLVYSANTASRIDVSSLTKGVYVIQTSSNGTSRFVVE